MTKNIMCSLTRMGLRNIVFWALDNVIHNEFLKVGKLSIFLPGFPLSYAKVTPKEEQFRHMMRLKPKVMAMFLNAGLDVWYMDADVVALDKLFGEVSKDTSSDVFFGLVKENDVMQPSASMMFLRNSHESKSFVQLLRETMDMTTSITDQQALRRVLKNRSKTNAWDVSSQELATDISKSGNKDLESKKDYRLEKAQISLQKPIPLLISDRQSTGILTSSDNGMMPVHISKKDFAKLNELSKQSDENHNIKDKRSVEKDFYKDAETNPVIKETDTPIRVKNLDVGQYVNVQYDPPVGVSDASFHVIPDNILDPLMIHVNGKNVQEKLKAWNFWLLDETEQCDFGYAYNQIELLKVRLNARRMEMSGK